jgi:hypothetical protein
MREFEGEKIMNEKRMFPRLSRNWGVECQMSKSLDAQPVLVKGEIRDLSMGGFSFKSNWVSASDAFFPFAINPTDDFKPMVGVAQISWTRGIEGGCESGAKFVWVDWKGIEPQIALGQYIADNLSKGQA